MNIQKKKISDLTLCYWVTTLQHQGRRCLLAASEKAYPAQLFDENGNYIILDIGEYGYYDKDQCFIINGLANGDATIVFTDMGNAYRLTLVVSVNEGRLSLESQKMERTEQ